MRQATCRSLMNTSDSSRCFNEMPLCGTCMARRQRQYLQLRFGVHGLQGRARHGLVKEDTRQEFVAIVQDLRRCEGIDSPAAAASRLPRPRADAQHAAAQPAPGSVPVDADSADVWVFIGHLDCVDIELLDAVRRDAGSAVAWKKASHNQLIER